MGTPYPRKARPYSIEEKYIFWQCIFEAHKLPALQPIVDTLMLGLSLYCIVDSLLIFS